jgi:pimeloyl-ACP methyl ester carboxylesterase
MRVSAFGQRCSVTRLFALLAALLGVLAAWARRTRTQPPMPGIEPDERRVVLADDGTELNVEIGGRADSDLTIVFTHGFLARAAEFDPQWESVLGRARLVRYDHRGHGRSGALRKASNVEQLGADLGRVLDEAAPSGPLVLVGHSMGGMTIMALAEQRPDLFGDRVRGVMLLATGAGHTIDGHPFENAWRAIGRRRLLAPGLLLLRLLAPAQERFRPRNTWLMRRVTRFLLFGTQDANPSLVAQIQQMLEEPPLRTAAALHGALLRHDKRDALTVLARVPVAVVGAQDDRLTRVEHSYEIARTIGPSAELTVVPGAGHALNRSRPHDVNAALARLLDRVEQQLAAAA